MKLNNTYVLLNSGNVAERVGWAQAHKAISDSVKSMRWPNRKGVRKFASSEGFVGVLGLSAGVD